MTGTAPLNSNVATGNNYFASLGSSIEFAGQQTNGPPNGVFQYVGNLGQTFGVADIVTEVLAGGLPFAIAPPTATPAVNTTADNKLAILVGPIRAPPRMGGTPHLPLPPCRST